MRNRVANKELVIKKWDLTELVDRNLINRVKRETFIHFMHLRNIYIALSICQKLF